MKSTTLILPLLASVAAAQPHKHVHRHPVRHNEARNEPVIQWVTEYEYTTEIVPYTTTIWVSEGYVPPAEPTSTSTQHKNTVPAQFFEPASKKSSSSAPTSSSVYVAPAPIATPAQPTTAPPAPTQAAEPVEEVKPSTDAPSSPQVVEPVTTPVAPVNSPEPVIVAAPAVSSAPASSSGSNSGSSSGPCSSGSPCNGDITHYDANVGLGACGWQSDGKTENIVALSHLLMGTQSNGNPYCGKTITVKLNGKSITAKVVDKCMGCEIHAIDLSEAAFSQLADMGIGRTQVEWYFN